MKTQLGATCHGTYTLTQASGFAGGAPYSAKYKGVREGRGDERAVYGVWRTGKAAVEVPELMLLAARLSYDKTSHGEHYRSSPFNTLPDINETQLDNLEGQIPHLASFPDDTFQPGFDAWQRA